MPVEHPTRRKRRTAPPIGGPEPPPAPPIAPVPKPEPAPSVVPSGPIRALSPQGRAFGLDWFAVARWLPQMRDAAAEHGAPVARVAAHVAIESGGNPDAVQRNPGNGDSYGLMQVVPRWWRRDISRLAGVNFASDDAAGHAMQADPRLALRAGCFVLAAYYRQFGADSWDEASSGFFTGKSRWQGIDTANGNSGAAYQRSLDALIAEWESAAKVPIPAPSPAPSPQPKVSATGVLRRITDYPDASVSFAFNRPNLNGGHPQNWYGYGVGHGTTAAHMHSGIDVAVPRGTVLHCPLAGVVRCVGRAGHGDWGQSCGAFADDLGGVGNVTVLTDAGLKLTFGHMGAASVRVGERVQAGQAIGISGTAAGFPHLHLDASIRAPERTDPAIWRNPGEYFLLDPLPAIADALSGEGITPEPTAPYLLPTFRAVAVAGGLPILLPDTIAFEQLLTPRGPNRSGAPLRATGVTQHETGNPNPGMDAPRHAKWQRDGTPGHPDGPIGVHFYVDDQRVVQTIPIDEQGVHSGDWRNQSHIAVETCVNAGRDQARAERLSAYLVGGLLRQMGESAKDAMYPHHMPKPQASGCPVHLGQRWFDYERQVDRAIAEASA